MIYGRLFIGGKTMAEFCEDCFRKIFKDCLKKDKLVISEEKELCEGCGKVKCTVVMVEKG